MEDHQLDWEGNGPKVSLGLLFKGTCRSSWVPTFVRWGKDTESDHQRQQQYLIQIARSELQNLRIHISQTHLNIVTSDVVLYPPHGCTIWQRSKSRIKEDVGKQKQKFQIPFA